jgi:hypothetical protein
MSRLHRVIVFSLLIPVASHADEFAWEASGASSSDSGSIVETDTWSAAATYHFRSVDDGKGPYALASFYDPVTRISAGVNHAKATVESLSCYGPLPSCTAQTLESSATTDDYGVSGRYVFPSSHWYVGGVYSRGSTDLPPTMFPTSKESRKYGVLVGKYLGPKTSLELAAQSSVDRLESTLATCGFTLLSYSCYPSDFAVIDTTNDQVALSAQHVRRFRGLTYSLSGRVVQTAGHQDAELHALPSPVPPVVLPPIGGFHVGVFTPLFGSYFLGRYREYAVGADLFPTAKIGVRIGYSTFDGDSPTDYAYDIGASWFITHHVGLRFDFDRAQPAFGLPSVDTAIVQVTGRF